MRQIFQWMAREAAERTAVDQRFEPLGNQVAFDTRWIAGKVVLSTAEAASVRHTLYLIYLLPYVTQVPFLLLFGLLALGQALTPPAGFSTLLFTVLLFALMVVVVPLGSLLQFPFMAMVARGKAVLDSEEML